MGCAGSSNVTPSIEAARKRLSVGMIDGDAAVSAAVHDDEADRGLMTTLKAEDVVELCKSRGTGNRRISSIGSAHDVGKHSFGVKKMDQAGDKFEGKKLGIGYTCRKGLKPESPNQDSWCLVSMDEFAIYGVFDGHGPEGHHISLFVKENLPKLIIRDPLFKREADGGDIKKCLHEAFTQVQSLITTATQMEVFEAKMSGTTATIAVHSLVDSKLYVAHVADSTGVLGLTCDPNHIQAVQLTRDHKPDLKDEKARIEKAGGRVIFDGYANHRIFAKDGQYPGLNMSRCLGDLVGHQQCGVTCEPELLERTIGDEDNILLLCSDGVWEFISPQEAVKFVNKYPVEKAQKAAERLAKEAWDRWMEEEGGTVVDDITVVLVHLKNPNSPRDD
eukprot:TRINITY_DN3540_c0_g2_i2.p1 TRINITY_DN3540_c0_g2~~TRINITY_DN3540_c0_g2_i2.p1  ORF type:complete len:389 (+),score=86.71 TRINITY_DN3540_c0_g2_i2:123-1289(+)